MADDIVTRLRQLNAQMGTFGNMGELCYFAADEIERLRSAGDALAEYLMMSWRSDAASDLVAVWKEARRG